MGPYDPPEFGLTDNIKGNAWHILMHGCISLMRDVRNAPSIADKINYCIKPPGWRHEPDLDYRATRLKELAEQGEAYIDETSGDFIVNGNVIGHRSKYQENINLTGLSSTSICLNADPGHSS